MDRNIIAVLGLPGSGKTEAIGYLEKKYSWPKVYFGEITFDEMRKRGLAMNQENERKVREDLRIKFGKTHYVEKIIEKINNLSQERIILVESLYQWEEYLMFKNKFKNIFITIAICSSPGTRYKRLANRKERPLNFEEAESRDHAQIEFLSQGGPIAMADYTIINEYDLDYLHKEIDNIIKLIIN